MLAPRWAKAAVAYFVIGVGFGIYMTWSQNHQFPGLHAHINLLGWASMALIASFYRVFPELERHRFAEPQFWLYQIAFPIMMAGLFLITTGNPAIGGPIVAFAGSAVTLAVVLFAVSVFGSVSGQQSVQGGKQSVQSGRSVTRRVG